MKKSLSVAMVVAMVSSMFASLAFADEAAPAAPLTAEQKYEALKKAGVLEGDETGANLEGHTNRAMIAKILAKAFNLTEDASAASGYTDITDPSVTWATGYIGAVTKAKLMEGPADGKFAPGSDVTMQELATVLVRAFDLDEKASTDVGTAKVDGWAKGYVAAALKSGLVSNKADFTAAALRSDLVYSTYVASQGKDVVALTADKWEVVDSKNVKVTFSDKTTQTFPLATALEAGKATTVTVVYKEKEFSNSVTLPVVTSQDISSAVALNSKVVEVKLGTAATTVDASNFTVKDAAGTAVAVASAQIAPYVTDGKTVLVTLGADTTAGTLYTITSGSKSINFGGKAVDSTKPSVSKVESVDYNLVDVTFNEAVDISGATVTIKEAYGTQTALVVNSTSYNGSTVLRLNTGDQKDATLYSLSIAGVKDFAGNTMDTDTAKTVVGQSKPTAKQSVASAVAVESKTVYVTFNVNVDPATLTAANFTIKEAYGNQTALAVDSVRIATTSDRDATNTALSSANAKKTAVVTLKDASKDSTLYNVTVANVNTLYGVALDTAKATTTFVGKAAPTSLTYNAAPVTTSSNTTVNIKFSNKLDKASAETLSNYAIVETYGNKAALEVKAAALQSDGVTVKLTVGSMSNALYTLTTTGLKDVYGNSIKTDSSANVTSFAGAVVAAKISAINSATLSSTDATQLTVVFNQSVGASATDVAHYSIDGGIGYPSKVAYDSTNPAQVVLTIPKTNDGQVYNLTVTGLENADNVAMDSAGVTGKFVGAGVTAGLPQLTAAIATDKQTLKLYFDRSVTDSSINNTSGTKVWNSNTHLLTIAATYTANGLTSAPNTPVTGYAYQDPSNANVLVVRAAGTPYTSVTNSNGTFTLQLGANEDTIVNKDKDNVVFAANNTDAAPVQSSAASAIDSQTLRVYFNQPVDKATISASINTAQNTTNETAVSFASAVAVDSSNTVYDVKLPVTLTGNTVYYLLLKAASDTSHNVNLKDESTGVTGVLAIRQFAGNATAPGAITSVPVTMADARTLLVWFPEKMDTATVQKVANYTLTDGSAAVAVGSGTLASEITNIAYDSATNKATITLKSDIASGKSAYYLVFNQALANAVGTKFVQTSTSSPADVKTQFALSGTAGSKLSVSSATYNAGLNQVTVKFNKNVLGSTITDADFAVSIVKGGSKVALTAGTDFTVLSVTPSTDNSATAIVTGGVAQSTAVVLQLAANGLGGDATGVGEVNFVSGSTRTGINGVGVDATVKAVFAQK